MAIDFKKLVKGLILKDETDPSKGLKLQIDPTAATNTTTTIIAEQLADVTLSLPGETSELVGDIANQTLENKTIDAANNTIVGITDAEISATAGVDVTKLADGSVDNTEFQHLNGVSSNIQTQLSNNASAISDHINDTSGAHAASAISNTPSGNLSATDLQAAVNELQSDIDTRALASNLTAHITDTTDAHLSSAIGYSGNANSTVEGALDNLYTYKLNVGSSQQLVSDLNANSNKITALATPVSGTDAANKNYVDGIAAGLDPKESVRVATTTTVGGSYATTPSNGRFTGAATTIDGVTLSANDRVLIKDQADAKQNGIYVYDGAGQFTRSADMDGSPSSEVSGGNFVFVAQGTTNGASGFVLVANGIVTLNTDNLNFTQFSGGANSANKTLSNLDAPTSINQDLLPSSNNSKSLGSSSLNYQNAYITTLKDNSGVDSHAVSSRILKDSAGSNSIDYSNTSEVSFNSKKLNSLGSAAGLNYATTKQNVQEYIKNLIPDGDAEGANIISVYNDSSTTRPVDGTGGTQANLAATITSTNPLSGTNSFLLTKSGSASTQGSGFSIPFTVPIGQQAKVLQIDIDYIVNSGTFVAGSSSAESDMIVYLYDVTNSTLIEPSSIKFLSNSSTISDKFTANFQTSATGTSYRLILHCQSTSTANYALKCEFSVKPCNYVYGTPISDWQSYTPTMVGFGSTTNNDSYWRRVGDSIELCVKFIVGTSTATEARLPLPSGLTVGKFGTGKFHLVGRATRDNTGSSFSRDFGLFAVNGNSYLTFSIIDTSGTSSGEAAQNGSSISVSGDDFVIRTLSIPITGWSSNSQVSDGWDARQIATLVNRVTSSQTISGASDVKIQWNNKVSDLTASFDSTTNYRFTVPSSGVYKFSGNIAISAAASSVNVYAYLYKNGSPVRTLGTAISSTTLTYSIPLNGQDTAVAGDYYEVFVNPNSVSMNVLSSASINGGSHLSIEKLQSPQTMSATEVVAASYRISADKTPSVSNPIDYDTKIFDTHNAVTTGSSWKFTAPVQGLYRITTTNATSTTGGTLDLYVNGSQDRGLMSMSDTSVRSASATVSLLAGGYISVNPDSASKTFTGTKNNTIYIERIK